MGFFGVFLKRCVPVPLFEFDKGRNARQFLIGPFGHLWSVAIGKKAMKQQKERSVKLSGPQTLVIKIIAQVRPKEHVSVQMFLVERP